MWPRPPSPRYSPGLSMPTCWGTAASTRSRAGLRSDFAKLGRPPEQNRRDPAQQHRHQHTGKAIGERLIMRQVKQPPLQAARIHEQRRGLDTDHLAVAEKIDLDIVLA